MSYGGQTHGREAAAAFAVRVASELAGGDLSGQVGGDGLRGAREDAVFRAAGRRCELAEDVLAHIEHRIEGLQAAEIGENGVALREGEDLGIGGSALGREETEPDLDDLGAAAPEAEKFFKVAGAGCDLRGDGAVDKDLRSGDALEDALIGRGLAAGVVLGG